MNKKMISLIVFMVLCIAVIAGCTKKEEKPAPTSMESSGPTAAPATPAATQAPTTGYTLPLSTTGEQISIGTVEAAGEKSLTTGLPVWNEIEKRTGVKVNWEPTPFKDYATVMQTRLAAGSNLPDIIFVPPGGDAMKYATDGLFLDLTDLINKYAPNIKALFEKEPDVRKKMTATDGKIYFFPGMITENNGEANDLYNNLAMLIRPDWLKKLGLKTPETIDELTEVLKAFKDKDPNGNGKADEIPFSGYGKGASGLYGIGWSYGLHLAMNKGIYPDKDGKVQYELIKPEFKEMLTKLNEWWNAGLIDKAVFDQAWDKFNAQVVNDKIGFIAQDMTTITPEAAWNGQLRTTTKNPEAAFYPMFTPAGPHGDRIIERLSSATNASYFALTKDTKNPELAVKWMDYAAYSPDGLLFDQFGLEGTSYTMVNGEPAFTDTFSKSKDGLSMELWRIGALHSYLPETLTVKGRATTFAGFKSMFDISAKIYEVAKDVTVFPAVLSTPQESEQSAKYMADIDTYVNEMVIKFITGSEPLSNFDKYVENVKKMGIDELIKIKQAQYDRYLKS